MLAVINATERLVRAIQAAVIIGTGEDMAKKTPKPTIKKAHRIADAIPSGRVRNRFAVGMAAAKKSARKRKAKRRG